MLQQTNASILPEEIFTFTLLLHIINVVGR